MVNINTRYCFVSKDHSCFVYSDASAAGGGVIIDFNNDFGSVAKCRGSWVVGRGRGSWVWVVGLGCGYG